MVHNSRFHLCVDDLEDTPQSDALFRQKNTTPRKPLPLTREQLCYGTTPSAPPSPHPRARIVESDAWYHPPKLSLGLRSKLVGRRRYHCTEIHENARTAALTMSAYIKFQRVAFPRTGIPLGRPTTEILPVSLTSRSCLAGAVSWRKWPRASELHVLWASSGAPPADPTQQKHPHQIGRVE